MKKIINIGGKDYTIQSSALTQFKYRDMTGRKLMQDINKIKDLRKENDDILAVLDDFLEILLQITYVMIIESDVKQVGSFEDFLKGIEKLFDDTKWVDEVIDLAVTPISGEIKQIPNNSQSDEPIDEYEVMALAKRLNITMDDMKEMSFVSLLNILLSTIENESFDGTRKATQEDIDRVFG